MFSMVWYLAPPSPKRVCTPDEQDVDIDMTLDSDSDEEAAQAAQAAPVVLAGDTAEKPINVDDYEDVAPAGESDDDDIELVQDAPVENGVGSAGGEVARDEPPEEPVADDDDLPDAVASIRLMMSDTESEDDEEGQVVTDLVDGSTAERRGVGGCADTEPYVDIVRLGLRHRFNNTNTVGPGRTVRTVP